MPKKVEITCDSCNKDLTTCESGWSETRLHLEAQGIYNTSNISFGMPQRKEVSDSYFCNLSCLESWLTKRAADLAGTCPHLSAEFDYICMRCGELVPTSRRQRIPLGTGRKDKL